jgi:Domain of unknown function (DUF4326)
MSGQHEYIEDFLPKAEADALFELASSWPRKREDAVYAGKVIGKKRIIGLGSFSISPNKRGLKDGVVNPKARSIDDAPPEVVKLAERLTELNGGKAINYLSFIAYENEMDHIDWHQHNEDRCRDAKVFIISLGEVRTFGIRRICEQHRLCGKCNSSCHQSGKTLCKTCKAKRKARKSCKVCETTSKKWTTLQPKHGSAIVLPHDYNLTHEHAVLGKQDAGGDKGSKGLRISINTKNIREEDVLYVERENRVPVTVSGPPIPSGMLKNISQMELDAAKTVSHAEIDATTPEPKTEVVHCKKDHYDIYIGKVNGKKGTKGYLPESKFANRSGGDYESYFRAKLRNTPGFAADVMTLHGKRLGCWCKGTRRDFSKCHGHTVVKWADAIHAKWQELKPDKAAMRKWIAEEAK